ncbi:MAG: universal stress protein, partial [Alphaproteobacteria bacterium]|nr:universal stress protein [Alphaproteobacteria bacterium]
MGFRVVLVPLSGSTADERALATAAAVARKFGARVEALHAAGDPRDAVPFVGEGASGALVEQIVGAAEKDLKRRAETARATYAAWSKAAGADTELLGPEGSG